ncbi:MAG: 30S ribosomal protein S20 [Wolbachia endosymbiont of Menacanthus eurysternus]|nr:MAG: 30S ribosomal protein S20 [Wolbachia endosymbiont of Menacanthus eurysternus]
MANHKNAKKMIKIIAKRNLINKMFKNKTRTAIKKLVNMIESGNKKNIAVAFQNAESNLQKCASRGIIHKNTAARKIRRLNIKVKTLISSS